MTVVFTINPPAAPAPTQAPSPGSGSVGPGGARALPTSPVPSLGELQGMTPTERHNAFARAYGAPQSPVPLHELSGRPASPPPSRPAAPSPEDRIAAFDRDMQQQGIQQPSPQPALPVANDPKGHVTAQNGVRIFNGQSVDAAAIERVNVDFRQEYGRLANELTKTAGGARAAIERQMTELSASYQGKLAALMPGQPEAQPPADTEVSTEDFAKEYSVAAKDGTRTLNAAGQKLEQDVLAEFKALTPAEQEERRDFYNIALVNLRADDRGMVHIDHFNPQTLHGYTLPKLIPDQHYSADIIDDLARARRLGLTQQQLNDEIARDMRVNGWIK